MTCIIKKLYAQKYGELKDNRIAFFTSYWERYLNLQKYGGVQFGIVCDALWVIVLNLVLVNFGLFTLLSNVQKNYGLHSKFKFSLKLPSPEICI